MQEEINTNDLTVTPKKNNPLLFLTIFAIALSILALVLSILFYLRTINLKVSNENNWKNLKIEQEFNKLKIAQSEEILKDLKLSVIQNQQQFTKTQAAFNQLLNEKNTEWNKWTLLAIRYQLIIANLSLHYLQDVDSAKMLLTSVSQQLQTNTNPQFNSIQQMIANASVLLENFPKLDLNLILNRLDALKLKIKELVPKGAKKSEIISPVAKDNKTWKQFLKQNLEKLSQLIVIRRHTSPIQPILSLEAENNLQTTILLALQQAAFSAMRNDANSYHLSLEQAKNLINTYYVANDKRNDVINMINQLNMELRSPALPDLTNVINLTNQLLQSAQTSS